MGKIVSVLMSKKYVNDAFVLSQFDKWIEVHNSFKQDFR